MSFLRCLLGSFKAEKCSIKSLDDNSRRKPVQALEANCLQRERAQSGIRSHHFKATACALNVAG
jgi:hypothetical protein